MPLLALSTRHRWTWRAVPLLACGLLAAACDGDRATAPQPLHPSVGSLVVDPIDATLAVRETLALSVTVLSAEGTLLTGRTVGFSSSDHRVATVSAVGLITAAGLGTATITVSSGSIAAQLPVTVRPGSLQLQLSPSIHVGWASLAWAAAFDHHGWQIQADVVSLMSDDVQVARLVEHGTDPAWDPSYFVDVVGVSEGEATISADVMGVGQSANVTVLPALIDVSPAEGTISVGGSLRLGASVLDEDGNEIPEETLDALGVTVAIEWISDEPGVATVDAEGLVTGVAPGRANIYAGPVGPDGPHFSTAATAVITVD
jgi:trimeric autotransporter adhesin